MVKKEEAAEALERADGAQEKERRIRPISAEGLRKVSTTRVLTVTSERMRTMNRKKPGFSVSAAVEAKAAMPDR